MQPERILGGEYGIHSEVWSLGVSVLEVSLCTSVLLVAYSLVCVLDLRREGGREGGREVRVIERERGDRTVFNSADLALCRWH